MAFEKYVFLLGGHDLEMIEIEKMLIEKKIKYFDEKLQWGAKLSAYKDKFDDEHTFVGIELIQDCEPPKNYILIDHHNENSHKASSIEQVAELLGLELDKHQQLVAANDRGYIPAMLEMGATDKEINDIRSADREAQGVTEKDEKLAAESIEKHQWKIGNVIIIESLTPKFSAITDQLFPYDELLIRHKNSFTYYGKKAAEFSGQFKDLIEKHKAYSGGNKQSFFGIDANTCTEVEAKESYIQIVNQIKHMETHSYHIFMFPFHWKQNQVTGNSVPLKFSQIEDLLDSNYWEKYKFQFKIKDEINTYNDFQYFYSSVREVLNLEHQVDNGKVDTLQFQYKGIKENSEYVIRILENNDYLVLQINDVTVNFYENGVGMFSFHLTNCNEDKFERILKINEYGRRIYPQFLGISANLTEATKKNFLAQEIELKNIKCEQSSIIEDFTYYDYIENISNKGYFHLPNHIQTLLGVNFGGNDNLETEIALTPIIDDRMFVICHYYNEELLNKLSIYDKKKEEYSYQTSSEWYRYIFIDDSNPSCRSQRMLKQQLLENTYDRWIEGGQLYGISRYSFVLLTDRSWYTKNIVINHIKTVYFEMVMLCLLQRAYVIYFGNEIARISKNVKDTDKQISKNRDDISLLSEEYIRFVNRVYFREITPQEQGIELYDLLHKHMRIEAHIKKLELEFVELNQLSEIIKTKENTRRNKLLQQLGAFFAVPAFILAFTNHEKIKTLEPIKCNPGWLPWVPEFALLITIILCSTMVYHAVTHSNKRLRVWISIILALAVFFAYIVFFQNPFQPAGLIH